MSAQVVFPAFFRHSFRHGALAWFRRSNIFTWLVASCLAACVQASAVAVQTEYDSGDPSADEQVVLELINRARANPAAEGARLGININEGLAGGVLTAPRPPLAMSKILLGTARAHSIDMYTHRYFAHNGSNGKLRSSAWMTPATPGWRAKTSPRVPSTTSLRLWRIS